MHTDKFFTLSIQGDGLDPDAISESVNLPCVVYHLGEITSLITEEKVVQKTNRWLYRSVAQDETSVRYFLTKNLEAVKQNLPVLREYFVKYKSSMELVVYTEGKTYIKLSKKQINLVSQINLGLSIVFFNW